MYIVKFAFSLENGWVVVEAAAKREGHHRSVHTQQKQQLVESSNLTEKHTQHEMKLTADDVETTLMKQEGECSFESLPYHHHRQANTDNQVKGVVNDINSRGIGFYISKNSMSITYLSWCMEQQS